ncbi:MAG: HEAT repeat domain-containing protein, partial [Thermoanaerobaculia bacterium]
ILGALSLLGGPAAAAVARALEDSEAWIRVQAAHLLGEMGAAAVHTAPLLERALRDPEPAVREAAGRALTRVRGREGEAGR